MSAIIVCVIKHKKFKDKEIFFELDSRDTGQIFRSPSVCIDNDDLQQLSAELSSALGSILGQV